MKKSINKAIKYLSVQEDNLDAIIDEIIEREEFSCTKYSCGIDGCPSFESVLPDWLDFVIN